MFRIAHLEAIRLGVSARLVGIRRVAIEERAGRVITPDDFDGGRIFDLHALESLDDFRQALDAPQPVRNRARHAGARGEHAMRPAPFAARLRETGAGLPGADKKSPRALHFAQALLR